MKAVLKIVMSTFSRCLSSSERQSLQRYARTPHANPAGLIEREPSLLPRETRPPLDHVC